MAESTLSLQYSDLLTAVAHEFYGVASVDLTADELLVVDRVIQSGYRQFLYPPAVGSEIGYEWSFLKPWTTISTAIADDDQDLPDDFGTLIEGFHFAANAQIPSVFADIGEGTVIAKRQMMTESGYPRFAAIRTKAGTGTVGQRKEVMWYPTPDAIYVLSYKYYAYVGKLTVALPYPLGGLKHAETIRSSCIASGDSIINGNRGAHYEHFIQDLASSIQRDKNEGAKIYGSIGGGHANNTPNTNYTLTVSGIVIQ